MRCSIPGQNLHFDTGTGAPEGLYTQSSSLTLRTSYTKLPESTHHSKSSLP